MLFSSVAPVEVTESRFHIFKERILHFYILPQHNNERPIEYGRHFTSGK